MREEGDRGDREEKGENPKGRGLDPKLENTRKLLTPGNIN